MGLTLRPNEFIRFLEEKGYRFVRAKGGSHHIYSNGRNSVPLPIHGGKDYNEDFIRTVLRETGIHKNELLVYLKRN
ncbi:MAG: type II toxin-antitoxin system HicA family toxin [Clostridiales bacterium]|nr:type II toxin-antitoxin system HicA family toxin [Clostridiales bacterium]